MSKINFFTIKRTIILPIALAFLGIVYIVWNLENPSPEVQEMVKTALVNIEKDEAAIKHFGNIIKSNLVGYAINGELGSKHKHTPGKASIRIQIYGSKNDGSVECFFNKEGQNWVFERFEM